MADLVREGDELVVRLTDLEKLGAVSRDVRVPLSAVRHARVSHDPFGELRGIRAPGAGIPGRLALGTWRTWSEKDFVAIHRGAPALVVELAEGPWRRLVIGTADPDAALARLELPTA